MFGFYRHLKSTPFHTFFHSHIISYHFTFSFSSHFINGEFIIIIDTPNARTRLAVIHDPMPHASYTDYKTTPTSFKHEKMDYVIIACIEVTIYTGVQTYYCKLS